MDLGLADAVEAGDYARVQCTPEVPRWTVTHTHRSGRAAASICLKEKPIGLSET